MRGPCVVQGNIEFFGGEGSIMAIRDSVDDLLNRDVHAHERGLGPAPADLENVRVQESPRAALKEARNWPSVTARVPSIVSCTGDAATSGGRRRVGAAFS